MACQYGWWLISVLGSLCSLESFFHFYPHTSPIRKAVLPLPFSQWKNRGLWGWVIFRPYSSWEEAGIHTQTLNFQTELCLWCCWQKEKKKKKPCFFFSVPQVCKMVHMFLSDQPAKHFLQPVFPRLSCSGTGLGDTSFCCCKGRFNLHSNHLGPGQSWDSGGDL